MTNKIDKLLDDLSYCGGTGKWDKHYLDVVEEIRGELYKIANKKPTYKQARKIIEDSTEYIIDMSHACELAHQYTENECIENGIRVGAKTKTGYTKKAQYVFDKHYKLITETLNV